MWAGVDVGGARKGFDVAVLDARGLAGRTRLREPAEVVSWLRPFAPRVVAVDSPRTCAPPGAASRPEERELAARICGIRYTPARELVADEANAYYEWIRRGLALYEALPEEWTVVECFPTATWTRLHGPRGRSSRASWSAAALAGLGVEGLPSRLGPRPSRRRRRRPHRAPARSWRVREPRRRRPPAAGRHRLVTFPRRSATQ